MTPQEMPLWKKYGFTEQYNLINRLRHTPLSVRERRLAETILLAEKERLLQRLNEIEGALIAVRDFPRKEYYEKALYNKVE